MSVQGNVLRANGLREGHACIRVDDYQCEDERREAVTHVYDLLSAFGKLTFHISFAFRYVEPSKGNKQMLVSGLRGLA